jgi:hypothetical protein
MKGLFDKLRGGKKEEPKRPVLPVEEIIFNVDNFNIWFKHPNNNAVYANEGICQFIFIKADKNCKTSYKDKNGKYNGHCGQTYAIPVRQKNQHYNFTLTEIQKYVDEFFKFAKRKKELVFYVMPIACNKKAYKNEEIAPMFKNFLELENVYLPLQWKKYLNA